MSRDLVWVEWVIVAGVVPGVVVVVVVVVRVVSLVLLVYIYLDSGHKELTADDITAAF